MMTTFTASGLVTFSNHTSARLVKYIAPTLPVNWEEGKRVKRRDGEICKFIGSSENNNYGNL